ncbi:hypothetical protein Plec18167_004137 [Paecilomyces lecythidis]|uniref:CFEM domain-containing protein n=1 Tax=Paecilomyces lecythidis TaxID=3004212 RepID=A0ABR3XTB9_9EURO
MASTIIVAYFIFVAAAAQSLVPLLTLPDCPRNCILSILPSAPSFGCLSIDPVCLCKSTGYNMSLLSCATTQCSPTEVTQLIKAENGWCDLVGRIPTPTPSLIPLPFQGSTVLTALNGAKTPSSKNRLLSGK